MLSEEALIRTALQGGASGAAVIAVREIPFRPEFRRACEANSCGKYGKCWTCPPDVGDIDALIARARRYDRCLLFQTVSALEDSFDIEGMLEAGRTHNGLTRRVWETLRPRMPADTLMLSAGGCGVCGRCAREDGRPCRHPDRALAPLEAYGIAVSEAAALGGMKYLNGDNTVTFFSAMLYQREG
ncbi:MAG TPA: DUF2284 domain-containing protein [Firmicutes bacterium]|nr:DUF2284 domain-containing protein [Bacillota bacterium]